MRSGHGVVGSGGARLLVALLLFGLLCGLGCHGGHRG